MTTGRHERQLANQPRGNECVWIVTRFPGKCAECSEELARGAHILWLPNAERGKDNYCIPCGTDIAGSYPPPHYWERRDQEFADRGFSRQCQPA